MDNVLTKRQRCILLKNGIQIWIDEDKIETLKMTLESQKGRLIEINGEIFNTNEVSGIYTPESMEDLIRRKNGQWKDKTGIWRERGDRICKCGNVISYGKTCGIC